jgi:dephospho-CoA kinase
LLSFRRFGTLLAQKETTTLPPDNNFRSSPQTSTVIGVLGGIASGKSEVGRRLAGSGGTLIVADQIAHEILASPECVAFLRDRFGPDVIDSAGLPDRAAIGERVFRNPDDLRALEAWTHPLVRARILVEIEAARDSHRNPIVLDVPLLLENDAQHGLVNECDHLVFVDADKAVREQRARDNRNWNPGELQRREAAQFPMEKKRQAASHVIANREGITELEERIDALRKELQLNE